MPTCKATALPTLTDEHRFVVPHRRFDDRLHLVQPERPVSDASVTDGSPGESHRIYAILDNPAGRPQLPGSWYHEKEANAGRLPELSCILSPNSAADTNNLRDHHPSASVHTACKMSYQVWYLHPTCAAPPNGHIRARCLACQHIQTLSTIVIRCMTMSNVAAFRSTVFAQRDHDSVGVSLGVQTHLLDVMYPLAPCSSTCML